MSAKKSDTWLHFSETSNGGKCKYCFVEVKTRGNTTNLRNHLIRKHPTLYSVSQKKHGSDDGETASTSGGVRVNKNVCCCGDAFEYFFFKCF